jgi:hypothetical protein
MILQTIGYAVAKRVGGLLLGSLVLWQVAEHAGPSNGRAIVHLSTTPANLTVDDALYHVESLEQTPIVCELKPGRHKARMLRDEQVVYEEEFTIVAGEEVILSAWDRYEDGRSPQRAREACSPGSCDPRADASVLPPSHRGVTPGSFALGALSPPRSARRNP